ncbi:MAG: glutathione S-transferase N-terminal domain-containing protein [Kordiimonadaceae bacterium]|nr:glutathione S-transferase N-terminal domain-containing protein [Kordiimonadaceae bacterium]
MKLFYSLTSPYSRKILLLAKSLKLADDIEVVLANPLENDAALIAANPLAKVPALLMGDKAISDSPLIAEHLLRKAGADRSSEAYMRQLEVQALADGVTDAAVAIIMESRRPDAEQSALWIARWGSSIERGLHMLENQCETFSTGWDLGSMAVACLLDYLCFRHPTLDWQRSNPKCAAWFAEISKRPDMVETDPRM